ncbi:MAG TPA: PEP/pyruvate-binding domain-containing protein, partial [Hymenobacter sp.]
MILSAAGLTADQALGGKAHGLRRLRAAGVPVPDFAVITADTFDPVLAGVPTDVEGLALREARLRQFLLSAADEQALRALLVRWDFPQQPVVVRSSVTDEDGAHTAFAGLMDSFLNLTTMPQVLEAIARCAASAYSERALAYRQLKQLPPARPAVIVQRQVVPVASGVLFTTLPEYPQELAVHAVWGFGEGLVGGALEPDEFYLIKKNGQPSRHKIAHKPQQYTASFSPDQPGLQVVPVPVANQDAACLTTEQLAELFALGSRLEQELGGPQDVEFVVEAQGLWIVQARPITQPIPEVVVYDNSNIQESYCGVTTPLTFSFAQRAYATVYRQTMRVLGLPDSQIAAHESVLTQLLGLVKGRIYYNINNWYRGLQLLPSFRQNKADMEHMMGLEEPVDFVTDQQKTLGATLRMLPRLALNLMRLLRAFGQLEHRVQAFHTQFLTHYQRFYTLPLATLTAQELLHEKAWLDTHLLGNWTTPIINDFYVMMANGQVARRLKKAGIADSDEFLSCYLAGDALIASTEPTYHMQALARQAWPQPALRALIVAAAPNVHHQVYCLAPDFHRAVEAFLGTYGDRTAGELKLETLTMRVSPLVFYQYLRNFLLSAPAPATKPTTLLHQQAHQQLSQLLAGRSVWVRKRTWGSLQKLQRAIRYREALRLERTRLFGMYRALYLAMGEQLAASQQLPAPRDVFWLTEPEIAEALALGTGDRLPS